MRHISLFIVIVVLGAAAPSYAQQAGPVNDVGDAETSSSDSIFPLWKSLLNGKKTLPPYGVNLVLFDLSGQWDVKNFSAAVNGNELASVSGKAQVHPFTYGVRTDVWVFPFLNVFATAGGVKLKVEATGLDLPLGVGECRRRSFVGTSTLISTLPATTAVRRVVLMYAWNNVFTSADYSAVWTHLQSSTTGVTGNELRTDTASFRIGYIAGPIQPYIGARWVKKIDHFEGTVDGPNGRPVTFAVRICRRRNGTTKSACMGRLPVVLK